MTDRKWQSEPGESSVIHPWYKERSGIKCLKARAQKQQLCGALDGRHWRFVRSGLDDFRGGYPPLHADIFTQPQRGGEPAIFGLSSHQSPARLTKTHFSKEKACFSKQKRQYVDAVERRLKTHPLALYPHLESGMPPELFDEVLSVLDPDLHVKKEQTGQFVAPCEGLTAKPSNDETTKHFDTRIPKQESLKGPKSRNPYKWPEAKKGIKEDKMVGIGPLEDEGVKKVTRLLCDWVISLGGDTSDFTESSILSLFDSNSEKKTALAFPNQVLEPHETPEKVLTAVKCLNKDTRSKQLKASRLNKIRSSSAKPTYGAWYLDPKTWKKRPAMESLRKSSVTEDLELTQEPTEKDEELKLSHGTQAFKQYIISKGLRMPRFLSTPFLEEGGEAEQDQRDGSNRLKFDMQRGQL